MGESREDRDSEKIVVISDGNCAMCSASMRLLQRWKRPAIAVELVSSHSELAVMKLTGSAFDVSLCEETIIVYQERPLMGDKTPPSSSPLGIWYTHSDAVLFLGCCCCWPIRIIAWSLWVLVPLFIRDFFYCIIARQRYFISTVCQRAKLA